MGTFSDDNSFHPNALMKHYYPHFTNMEAESARKKQSLLQTQYLWHRMCTHPAVFGHLWSCEEPREYLYRDDINMSI